MAKKPEVEVPRDSPLLFSQTEKDVHEFEEGGSLKGVRKGDVKGRTLTLLIAEP